MPRRYLKSVHARKSFGKRHRRFKRQAESQARELQLPLDVDALVDMTRQALSSFATEMGLLVAQRLLEDEVTQRCGQAARAAARARHNAFRPSARLRDDRRPEGRQSRSRGFATPTSGARLNWSATVCCSPPPPPMANQRETAPHD